MNDHATNTSAPVVRSPRLWPVLVILAIAAAVQIISISPQIDNASRFYVMMLGPAVCALLFAGWLLLASRLRWFERPLIGMGVLVLGVLAAFVVHPSVGLLLFVYGVPLTILVVGIALWLGRDRSPGGRVLLALVLSACVWALFVPLRNDGIDGSYLPELAWRWRPTHEERLAAHDRSAPAGVAAPLSAEIELSTLDWPGFRGADRDSRARGARVRPDWENAPPRELWRIPVGPGWSSFAHVGGRLFTQAQLGDDEAVICYDAATGSEIWRHTYATRLIDVVAGPGPRATPTYADGRLYTLGSKASLRCLDAATGALHWQRDLMREIGAQLPIWGFSASPLVTHGVAIVYAGGRQDHGLVAYEALTGAPAWHVAGSGMNFASAQLAAIGGVDLVLFTNETGLLAIDPTTGAILWQFTPSGWKTAPLVQPQLVGERSVILAIGDGAGLARIDVERDGDGWNVTERWSSKRLRPSFNDFVYHEGHVYGFDQSNFTCVDAETGVRRWRGGRYGFGQVLLLEDSASMIVTTESGAVVLLAADPAERRELGRLQALDGKTWNHPVVVGERLFLRNGEEAVCFELTIETDPDVAALPDRRHPAAPRARPAPGSSGPRSVR